MRLPGEETCWNIDWTSWDPEQYQWREARSQACISCDFLNDYSVDCSPCGKRCCVCQYWTWLWYPGFDLRCKAVVRGSDRRNICQTIAGGTEGSVIRYIIVQYIVYKTDNFVGRGKDVMSHEFGHASETTNIENVKFGQRHYLHKSNEWPMVVWMSHLIAEELVLWFPSGIWGRRAIVDKFGVDADNDQSVDLIFRCVHYFCEGAIVGASGLDFDHWEMMSHRGMAAASRSEQMTQFYEAGSASKRFFVSHAL